MVVRLDSDRGDGFSTLKALAAGESGPLDSEALAQYLQNQASAQPLAQARILRSDLSPAHLCVAP